MAGICTLNLTVGGPAW